MLVQNRNADNIKEFFLEIKEKIDLYNRIKNEMTCLKLKYNELITKLQTEEIEFEKKRILNRYKTLKQHKISLQKEIGDLMLNISPLTPQKNLGNEK